MRLSQLEGVVATHGARFDSVTAELDHHRTELERHRAELDDAHTKLESHNVAIGRLRAESARYKHALLLVVLAYFVFVWCGVGAAVLSFATFVLRVALLACMGFMAFAGWTTMMRTGGMGRTGHVGSSDGIHSIVGQAIAFCTRMMACVRLLIGLVQKMETR